MYMFMWPAFATEKIPKFPGNISLELLENSVIHTYIQCIICKIGKRKKWVISILVCHFMDVLIRIWYAHAQCIYIKDFIMHVELENKEMYSYINYLLDKWLCLFQPPHKTSWTKSNPIIWAKSYIIFTYNLILLSSSHII